MKKKVVIISILSFALVLLVCTYKENSILRLKYPGNLNELNDFEVDIIQDPFDRPNFIGKSNYDDRKVLLNEHLIYKNNKKAQFFLEKNFWHPAKVRIVLSPWKTCSKKNGSNLSVFAYVLTRVSAFELRNQIRKTWANRTLFPNLNVAFVIGMSTKQMENTKAKRENKQRGDIIQGDFIDSYRNLSFKSIISWRWIKYNCMNAKYFLKIDDDVFMNTPKLLDHVVSDTFDPQPNSFSCIIWNNSKAERDETNKMYTTFEEWPNATFPTYCRGIAYLMTNSLPAKLYDSAYVTRDLWIDDAMTGIVANNIPGLVFNDWSRFFFLDGYNFDKARSELRSYFFFEPFYMNNKTAFRRMSAYLGIE
jgi:hypothetical protein